uniref:Uncharacterized protein n=1 Tax=Chlorokybus atmophyticus TaxID=3144 RepID=A2CI40_CHLAT|nr:hypothetical protein ChatCp006 [Chlorokybus atmophyticus]ABM87976.1 hypothetical protein [Chlorokybus atmophyticus]
MKKDPLKNIARIIAIIGPIVAAALYGRVFNPNPPYPPPTPPTATVPTIPTVTGIDSLIGEANSILSAVNNAQEVLNRLDRGISILKQRRA